jgi:gamma-glutamyl phosphate reductase
MGLEELTTYKYVISGSGRFGNNFPEVKI